MKKNFERIAFLFPGQGAQYQGMCQDFVRDFSAARLTFEEADDLLKKSISTMILKGPESLLTETRHSQIAIYATSMAILRVVQELYEIKPFACAGLSLGEYTALTAAEWLSFKETLSLVDHRGQFMNEACEKTSGTMVVVMGLDAFVVEEIVREVNLPKDLWVANFNCPGQVVLSGTLKGIEMGIAAAQARQAKKIIPLQVHGAFHSGLMQSAQDKLRPYIENAPLQKGMADLVMNVPGDFVSDLQAVRHYLIEQITHPVYWERGIRMMEQQGIDLFIEFGPGKTLAGMNKRIGVQAPTLTIETLKDLELIKKGVHR